MDRISVKATTSEKLGFTGRGERDCGAGDGNIGENMTRFIATWFYSGLIKPRARHMGIIGRPALCIPDVMGWLGNLGVDDRLFGDFRSGMVGNV